MIYQRVAENLQPTGVVLRPFVIKHKGFFLKMLYVISTTVHLMLNMVMIAMTVRAILSLFVNTTENKIYAIAYMISEPIIAPIRFLFYKLNLFQSIPLDISFLATYILLRIIDGALA